MCGGLILGLSGKDPLLGCGKPDFARFFAKRPRHPRWSLSRDMRRPVIQSRSAETTDYVKVLIWRILDLGIMRMEAKE